MTPVRFIRLPSLLASAAAWAATACVAGTVAAADGLGSSAEGVEHFERHIRPLLVEHCQECHSADRGKSKGGLVLDSAEGWLRGGDSGPALQPGDREGSLLIRAVRWDDPELQMPPKQRLRDSEIATLERWVELGGPGPAAKTKTPDGDLAGAADGPTSASASSRSHWAYQAPEPHEPPAVSDSTWPRSRIDGFILAGLERRGLTPARDADRATLCRRLHFDLVGLPPTPGQLEAFVSNPASDAAVLERRVGELLASPRFGEHWARHWFDIVRFAESVTLRGFVFPEAWRYRDYVIDSIQDDVPLNRFLREQIAGDLLPSETLEQRRRHLIASTFLMLGNTNLEEQDKRQLDMDFVDEQLDVIGKAFLGQTITCARCHDHKFDPIPTRDYYALAGILHGVVALEHANVSAWVEQPLPVEPAVEKELTEHEAAVARLKARLQEARKDATPAVVDAGSLAGIVVDGSAARRVGEWQSSTHTKPYVGDGYLHDLNQGKGAKTLTFPFDPPHAGRYEVRFAYQPGDGRSAKTPVTVFHAGGETLVSVDQRQKPPIGGLFVSLGVFAFETNGFALVLVANEGTTGHVIADAVQFLPLGRSLADAPPKEEPSVEAGEIENLERQLKELQASGPRRPKVMAPRESTNIVDLAVHRRGSVHNLGEIAPRGVLSAVTTPPPPAMPASESGRRELADWLVDPGHPLTARVMVNRVWLWTMGRGLVRTPDNFGTTGEPPTHPGLLDDLAVRFAMPAAEGGLGWSLKALVREIATSRAYGLSTAATADALEADPDNRLFGRAERKRLAAEQLRDAMLTVSGTLRVEPPNGATFPADVRADFGFAAREPWRSVYLPVFRNSLPELFGAFDFPSPSRVVGERSVSTVPTQALFLLNDPFVLEQARRAAARFLAESEGADVPGGGRDPSASEEDRLARLFRLALGRSPTPGESAAALGSLEKAVDDNAVADAWADLVHALFASIDFRYLN